MSVLKFALAASGAAALGPFENTQKPYPQAVSDERNLLKYLGNEGPYCDRRGHGLDRNPPAGCRVDQVVMLRRHGERWPTKKIQKKIQKTIDTLKANADDLTGSLDFVKDWEPLASVDDGYLSQETLSGPYAGLLEAYTHGTEYRSRYGHLYDPESKLPLFVSSYQRVLDTARKFGEGFLQWNYTDMAALNLIPEQNGLDTLFPYCHLKNDNRSTICPEFDFYDEYKVAAKRLNSESKDGKLNLEAKDIHNLMELVAYELNVRGSSPWANVFTTDEWVAHEYYVSSKQFCERGAGSTSCPIEGTLFFNASLQLLLDGPKKSQLPLAFNFAHDINIMQLVATMGIDGPKNASDWDPTETKFDQRFDISEIVPQGARFIFERLVCDGDVDEPAYVNSYPEAFNETHFVTPGNAASSHMNSTTSNTYVRIVLNEAVVPLDDCHSGPGSSCPLQDYEKWAQSKLAGMSFVEHCKLKPNEPTDLTFFQNYTLSSTLNQPSKVLPFQATTLDANGQPVRKEK